MSTNAMGQVSTPSLILSNATLPPVTTLEGTGYLDNLYKEWFERAGLRVQLTHTPAARGLQNANSGILGGDAARIDIDGSLYPNLLKLPEPVIEVVFSGLYVNSTINADTFADFENYRIGYVRGWQIAERLFGEASDAMAVRNSDNLMDMLAANRIDIAFLTVAPARELAREKKMGVLKVTDARIRKNLYLYLHSSHRDKIPGLMKTLRDMKSDGSYDRIMADYDLENR